MRRTALAAVAVALVAVAPASATLPVSRHGSALGEGTPLKAYASLTPTVHLFGDLVTAKLAVVADTKLVDPARLRVRASFSPYVSTRPPRVLRVEVGRFAQITWTWTLHCVTSPCVPRVPPSDTFHVFRFPPVHLDYLSRKGRALYGIRPSWPPVEVLSQVSPGVVAFFKKTNHLNWRVDASPVAAPTYRTSPTLLFWLAVALAGVLGLAALELARRWYRVLRPRTVAAPAPDPETTLERALAVLRHAHQHGDETLQRKAFERVAGELGVARADELVRVARELAWSPRTPEDEEVAEFAEQARGRPEQDA